MAIRQTSKQAKSKAEAKVDAGEPTAAPLAKSEREPQGRTSRAQSRSAARSDRARAAAPKARLNGSEMVHDKPEQAGSRSEAIAAHAALGTTGESGGEPPACTKRAQLIGMLERPEGQDCRGTVTDDAGPTKHCHQGGALARLPALDVRQLREMWCELHKTAAVPRLSRELLMRAVAYRIQELASGGLRPELHRQLYQIASELQQVGRVAIRPRPRLKPGTRLLRGWRGRSHQVLVLKDGFSWQAAHYRSLSAIARKITGTAWSGPLFFGLKANRSAGRRSAPISDPAGEPMEIGDAAG